MASAELDQYLGRQTVLAGAVNLGKTTRTTTILKQFLAAGYAQEIAVLDLAPDPVRGIGGKLSFVKPPGLLYLTAQLAAPRLIGRDAAEIQGLASANARNIENLFAELERQPRNILFLNDVTLYLQAGSLQRLLGVLQNSSTRIINAYYGDSFADSELTRRERELTEALMAHSDTVTLL